MIFITFFGGRVSSCKPPTRVESCMVNWLVVKTQAFGLCKKIVIGRQNQLSFLSNDNPAVQTKSPRLQHKPVYHALLLASALNPWSSSDHSLCETVHPEPWCCWHGKQYAQITFSHQKVTILHQIARTKTTTFLHQIKLHFCTKFTAFSHQIFSLAYHIFTPNCTTFSHQNSRLAYHVFAPNFTTFLHQSSTFWHKKWLTPYLAPVGCFRALRVPSFYLT